MDVSLRDQANRLALCSAKANQNFSINIGEYARTPLESTRLQLKHKVGPVGGLMLIPLKLRKSS
jgi:hypothetical protein